MNHIKAFCYEYGIIPNLWSANKKWWMSLPVDKLPKNVQKNTIFSMEDYKEQKEMELWETRMRMFTQKVGDVDERDKNKKQTDS